MEISRINATNIPVSEITGEKGKVQNLTNQVGQTFQQALDSLSESQENSDGLIQQLAAGEDVDLHQVMIASEETDVNFRVAIAIRDKLVSAYQEVMRMGV